MVLVLVNHVVVAAALLLGKHSLPESLRVVQLGLLVGVGPLPELLVPDRWLFGVCLRVKDVTLPVIINVLLRGVGIHLKL